MQPREVIFREPTPVGRYVTIRSSGLKSGTTHVEMRNFPSGLTADLTSTSQGTWVLEIVVNGGYTWDGTEHDFYFI